MRRKQSGRGPVFEKRDEVRGKKRFAWNRRSDKSVAVSKEGRDNLLFYGGQVIFPGPFQFVILLEPKPKIRPDSEKTFKAQCRVDGNAFPSIDYIGEA